MVSLSGPEKEESERARRVVEANDSGALMVARLKGDESAVHQAEMLANTRLNYSPSEDPRRLFLHSVKYVRFSLELPTQRDVSSRECEETASCVQQPPTPTNHRHVHSTCHTY